MSQKYLAWNGEEYPWPPPDGWYEASDDRWWAPNSGPGPKTAGASSPASDATGFGGELATQPSDSSATTATPLVGQPAGTTVPDINNPLSQFGSNPTAQQSPFGASQPQGTQQPPYGASLGQQQTPFTNGPPQNFQQPQYGAPPADRYNPGVQPAKSGSKLPFILAAILGVLVVGALAVFALTRNSGEDVATTTPTVVSSTTLGQEEEATTTTEPDTTTQPVDRAAALAAFRLYVEDLNIVGLDDASLDGIGDESCRVGLQSQDPAGWDDQLNSIVTNIRAQQAINPPPEGTPLTESAIEAIYTGALTFYCPAEAGRLEVSV